ncbi:MAG: PEFG-CTERM sorting domain-containing protein [Nitrosopumilus sp.]|nr:PEFG-CTERM sorting domain-containing protein [Nitrosopumilus sp.]MDH3384701.1 PEFG-CTERM sorting domain-containing protein [Nitrosopumilus sp.]
MKTKIFLIFTILIFSSSGAFAQSDDIPFLTVKTDDNHYDEGDTIVVSGQVETVIIDTPMILQIWSMGNMIDIAQFFPAQDGSYSHTIIAEKPLWKNEGEYVIRISYGTGNIAESSITFTPKQEYLETTDSFEVQIPNGGTFDLEYTINGGVVKDVILEPDNFTLLIQIESPDEGKISLKIPRSSLDAGKSDGQDEKFIVLIDNIQVPYEETETNSQLRFITINFEEGDSEIEIIGTFIVPEFGVITALILVSGIMIMIGFSKSKLSLNV